MSALYETSDLTKEVIRIYTKRGVYDLDIHEVIDISDPANIADKVISYAVSYWTVSPPYEYEGRVPKAGDPTYATAIEALEQTMLVLSNLSEPKQEEEEGTTIRFFGDKTADEKVKDFAKEQGVNPLDLYGDDHNGI